MSYSNSDWPLAPLWLGYFPRHSKTPRFPNRSVDRGKAATPIGFKNENRQTLEGTAAKLASFEKEKGTKMCSDLGSDYVCKPIGQFIPKLTEKGNSETTEYEYL